MKVVALDNQENFLEFLDPDMLDIVETASIGGLRTIQVDFNIQDLDDAKKLFKIGNKLWVASDGELTDCLYVINTKVKQSLLKENKFTFDAEEVLVELNYAPLFRQTDITSANGFTVNTVNGERSVTINWNALNYWFGDYFNIGIVQDCLNSYVAKVPLNGTMTLMSLLRTIEEETGNYFVTRYEKDVVSNVIHRYLDFLNPHSTNKNWELNLEYDFLDEDYSSSAFIVDDDLEEKVQDVDEDENVDDEDDPIMTQSNIVRSNINPNNVLFRVTKDGEMIHTWTPNHIGFGTGLVNSVISLKYKDGKLGLKAYTKVFLDNTGVGSSSKGFVQEWVDLDYDEVNVPNAIIVNLLDESYFEIYDRVHDKVLFSTRLNPILSNVHEEVLDLGFNVENVDFEVDETDTYTAISPVFSLNENDDSRNGLSVTDMDTIINSWLNLEVAKGDVIPMIVQKVNITGTDAYPCVKRTGTATSPNRSAEQILGTYNLSTRYYSRPIKPNDNTEGNNKSFEYWRATAYWRAPFEKHAGEMHIRLDTKNGIEYGNISCRPDLRDERARTACYEKMGTTNTSEEDVYAIYNAVAMYLKDHQDPEINLEVDVANLRDHKYNKYNLHDKVFIKLPGQEELITAKVDNTSKNAHNISKNTVKLSNYSIATKVAPKETYIEASNVSFKYPSKGTLTATLHNAGYSENDPVDVLKDKLVTFTVYKIENGSSTFTGSVYSKKTNANGQAVISMGFRPGDYEIEIGFGGDAEYEETSLTVEVAVSGTVEVKKKTVARKTTKTKTTSKNTVIKKTFWNKCGLSPDKKQIVAVAKPSAGDGNYAYVLWKTVFKNYCPECGRTGTLRFDGGKRNACITSSTFGHHWKDGVPEHEITCIHCDSDYDGVTGLEKDTAHSTRLTRVKKPVRSSQTEFNKLVTGKLQYGTKKVTVKSKTKTTKVTYNNHASGIAPSVKRKAISLAGGRVGLPALMNVAAFMGKHIHYGYSVGFTKSPAAVLSTGTGNCCSQTRLMLQMMDVVDPNNDFKLEYVSVCCKTSGEHAGVGHLFARVTTKKTKFSRYVDPCKDNPWGNYVHGWGNPPGRRTTYPTRPY